ncbi:hypothetical protein BVX99_00325, partial [bacterium F16]
PRYYPKRVQIDRTFKDKIIDNDGVRSLTLPDFVIVLKPTGKITRLCSESGTLISNLDIKSKSSAIQFLSGKHLNTKLWNFKFPDASKLPEGCFYLLPQVEGDRVKRLAETVKLKYRTLGKGKSPAPIALMLIGKENGLIYLGSDILKSNAALRVMKVAPEEGYNNKIILDPKSECHLFYIKLGKFFGKGTCSPIHMTDKDGLEVRTLIEVYLQPDATRNVRTL